MSWRRWTGAGRPRRSAPRARGRPAVTWSRRPIRSRRRATRSRNGSICASSAPSVRASRAGWPGRGSRPIRSRCSVSSSASSPVICSCTRVPGSMPPGSCSSSSPTSSTVRTDSSRACGARPPGSAASWMASSDACGSSISACTCVIRLVLSQRLGVARRRSARGHAAAVSQPCQSATIDFIRHAFLALGSGQGQRARYGRRAEHAGDGSWFQRVTVRHIPDLREAAGPACFPQTVALRARHARPASRRRSDAPALPRQVCRRC